MSARVPRRGSPEQWRPEPGRPRSGRAARLFTLALAVAIVAGLAWLALQ